MRTYIRFEFDPSCSLTAKTKDRLLDGILSNFYGGLPELFGSVLANLQEQSWVSLPNEDEHDYNYADCFKYDVLGLCRIFTQYGLSGRFWVTDSLYDAPPTGDDDTQERCDRNVIEFGPGIEDPYARRNAAKQEHDTQQAAWTVVHKLRTAQEWLATGGSGDVFELYHQLGPNFIVLEDRDRFREVCKKLLSEQGLLYSAKSST